VTFKIIERFKYVERLKDFTPARKKLSPVTADLNKNRGDDECSRMSDELEIKR